MLLDGKAHGLPVTVVQDDAWLLLVSACCGDMISLGILGRGKHRYFCDTCGETIKTTSTSEWATVLNSNGHLRRMKNWLSYWTGLPEKCILVVKEEPW